MSVKYFITKEIGTVSAGSTTTVEFTWYETIRVKRIYFVERSGAPLYNVDATIKFGDEDVLTREEVPISLFTYSPLEAFELNREVKAGTLIKVSVTNNGTSSVNLVLVLEVE